MYALAMIYDRAQSAISECVNELVEFLDETWEHLLACDREHLLHPSKLKEYAAAIHARGSPLATIIAFIDCTIRRICHLKYQALMLPNGIIGHLYGPVEGRRNDNFLLTESTLLEALAEFAHQEELRCFIAALPMGREGIVAGSGSGLIEMRDGAGVRNSGAAL